MHLKNKKVIGLLAAVLCAVCVVAQPLMGAFAFDLAVDGFDVEKAYLSDNVNGWVATSRRASNCAHPDGIGQVKLEAVDAATTRITTFDEDCGFAVAGYYGYKSMKDDGTPLHQLTGSTVKPSADGRYVFTVKVSSEGLDADEVYLPFTTRINGDWNRNCEITEGGLRIHLVKSDNGVKLFVEHPEVVNPGQPFDTAGAVRYNPLNENGVDFSLDTAHRFVIATSQNTTSVYVDNVLLGSVGTTESYFSAQKGADTGVLLGVAGKDTDASGSAACTVEVSVNAADYTEELTALVAACDAVQNDKANDAQKKIFADALAEAKAALNSGDEAAKAAALEKLRTEKTKFDGADVNANGWTAVKADYVIQGENSILVNSDDTANVLLYALGDTITEVHTTNYARGAAKLQQGVSPIRKGKFAIDFTLKEEHLAGNGHHIYLSLLWDAYCAGCPNVLNTNNGITFDFGKNGSQYYLWLVNKEKNTNFANDAVLAAEVGQKLHIVVETDETTHIARIYINGVFCGQSEVGSESSYLWNGGNATLALGGGASWDPNEPGGDVVAVIDSHAPDSTETLQALIDACADMENANATEAEKATFAAAIEAARADLLKDEVTVLQAIETLTEAKEAFASCGEVPERIELRKLISDCEKLAANTEASDDPTYEQTTTEAKTAFIAAINTAKSKVEGSTQDELKAALEALKAAKAEFEASILHDTGWRAMWVTDWDGIDDHTDEVEIRYISDGVTELLVGDTMTAGADLRQKFKPMKAGKWELDFTVLPEDTTSTWLDLDWAWLVYNSNPSNNEFTYPSVTTNGLQFKLNQLGSGSPKLSVYNRDTGVTYGAADGQSMDMAIGQKYHVVFETVYTETGAPMTGAETNADWEPGRFTTILYINDRVIAEFDTPNNPGYWTTGAMSLGIGGGGWTRLIVDVTPETNEEKLQALIADSEALLASKTASDTPAIGEVSTEDAAIFQTMIETAKKLENGNEAELIIALAMLDAAQDAFNDAVVGRVDVRALQDAIAEAEAVCNVLSEETTAYKTMSALIDEANALLTDDQAEQTAIDAKADALLAAVDTARAENLVFNIDDLDIFDPTGLEVKANGQVIRFTTTNRDGKLYSKDWFDVYTTLNGTKKLVFDITDLGRIDGQYSRVMFEDPTGAYRLYAEILTMEGEGTIRICQPQEDQEDPTVLIPLAAAEYTPGVSSQVIIEATADGKLVISIGGEKLYEETNELAAILNGEEDILVSLLSGGDMLDEQSMLIDFAATERTNNGGNNGNNNGNGSDGNGNNGSNGNTPAMGDTTRLAAVLAALGLSAGAAVLLAKKRRRSENG